MRSFEEKTLRLYIRQILKEMGGPAGASGSDPTDVKGFYPYEIDRGTDIYSYWYRSPGRGMGSDGDFRPSDPISYIGMSPPAESGGESGGGASEPAPPPAAE